MYEKVKAGVLFAVVVVVMISFARFSQGQEVATSAKQGAGMGYAMFGVGTLDIKDLNAKLESKGYTAISDNLISMGGGGHGIIKNKVIIGGEGHALVSEETTSGHHTTRIGVGYGLFDLGYIVYSSKDVRVYPLIGLGGGGLSLRIVEEETSLSFDEVLDNPRRSAELVTGGFLVNLALGVDYLLQLNEDERGRGGLIFGLRAGYTLSPVKGDWNLDEVAISGGPDMGITGMYVRLMIGGGGFSK